VLMQVLVATLADHPMMNAQLLGDDIEFFDAFDIGVAVDTKDGLMVPVVSGADQRDLGGLSEEIIRRSCHSVRARSSPSAQRALKYGCVLASPPKPLW